MKKMTYPFTIFLIFLVVSSVLSFGVVSGEIYDNMLLVSSVGVMVPYVVLQDGVDNVSTIFTNQTSAMITLNATLTSTTYSYTLNITNNSANPLNLTLQIKSGTNLDKINATITLHNGTHTETQIQISGGSASETDIPFTIQEYSTIYIEVRNLVENYAGIAYLRIYLKIDEYNVSTYILYPITFRFT